MSKPIPPILVDANLPRLVAETLRQLGFDARDVRDVGMRGAIDPVIAQFAREKGAMIFTSDFDFADIRNYPPEQYAGIVVFSFDHGQTRDVIVARVTKFVANRELLEHMPGRLAIVDAESVRLRPRLAAE